MDALSEVLRAVRLEGAFYFHGEFTAPWRIAAPGSAVLAPSLSPKAEHLIIFHYLTEGQAYAGLPGGELESLCAGDIVVFPHGDPHLLGNGTSVEPVDPTRAFQHASGGLAPVRFGGGGEVTKFVCGFMACQRKLIELLLSGLPKMMKVRVSSSPSGQWLENSIRFSVTEAASSNPGSNLMLTKLSELLFVETIRSYLAGMPEGDTGWLAGARDPVTGHALTLLHHDPAYPWTVALLARRLGVSRTRLAERFTRLLGESPMAYLARWRLRLGAEQLETSDAGIEEIAAAVGYGSAAAFNRAFRREYDCPPALYRRRKRGL